MKKMGTKSLCALVAAIALGIGGGVILSSAKPEYKVQTIRGQPVSVKVVAGGKHAWNSISAVIKLENGKYMLCNYNYTSRTYSDAAALIQSEIDDNDNEEIELTGEYEKGQFKMYSVRANDITVKL